jgi:hypothetical protein
MTPATAIRVDSGGWEPGPDEVTIGVDLVELLSSSMYVEPLTIYREYLQNSADAIDDARAAGALEPGAHGRVDIFVDAQARVIRIRDNGAGIRGGDFLRRLTAFGASEKRGQQKRGFRGVGRLAALGYCQELFFRSRGSADEPIYELRWDCRTLRTLLRAADQHCSLNEAVRRATSCRSLIAPLQPSRFFEVELRGVVRHGSDDLLNEGAVRHYLGQVAPVPFAPTFEFRTQIEAFLADVPNQADVRVFVNDVGPVYRPYGDFIAMRAGLASRVSDVSLVTIPAAEGGVAAKGWILHHDYLGAIPRELGVRGLRLRSGNVQVGDDAVLEHTFPEPRFNPWSVGEFHVLDGRIVPNGRRDQYEQSVHVANMWNHISPLAREISARCRAHSRYRQMLKRADALIRQITEGLAVLRQGAIAAGARLIFLSTLNGALLRLEQIANSQFLSEADRRLLARRQEALKRRLARAAKERRIAAQLKRLTPAKRKAYEEVFAVLYKNATDLRGARELVRRVLSSLGH